MNKLQYLALNRLMISLVLIINYGFKTVRNGVLWRKIMDLHLYRQFQQYFNERIEEFNLSKLREKYGWDNNFGGKPGAGHVGVRKYDFYKPKFDNYINQIKRSIKARVDIFKLWSKEPWRMFVIMTDKRCSWHDRKYIIAGIGIYLSIIYLISLYGIPHLSYSFYDISVDIPLIPIILVSYYWRTTGSSDAYDGLSRTFVGGTTGPKLTVAEWDNMDNASTFNPGDEINWETGDTFDIPNGETINTGNGTALSHLKIQSIGSGARPIWNQTTGNIAVAMNYVDVTGIEITGGVAGNVSTNNTYQTWDDCYVHTTSSSGMTFNGTWSYITVKNCTITDTTNYPIVLNDSNVTGGHHSWIFNNTLGGGTTDSDVLHYQHEHPADPAWGMGDYHYVFNNYFKGTTTGSDIDCTDGGEMEIYDNEFGNGVGYSVDSNQLALSNQNRTTKVYRNWFHDGDGSQGTVLLQSTTTTFWGNLMSGGTTLQQLKINDGYSGTGFLIYKNTFIYDTESADELIRINDNSNNLGTVDISYNIGSTKGANMPTNVIWFDDATFMDLGNNDIYDLEIDSVGHTLYVLRYDDYNSATETNGDIIFVYYPEGYDGVLGQVYMMSKILESLTLTNRVI